jgi:uncharacterized oligopeptide transporter (OPT) family protein
MAMNDALSRRRALGAALHTATATGSVAYLGPMEKGGVYILSVDQDTYFLQGPTNAFAVDVPAAGASARPLFAKSMVQIECVTGTDDEYVGVRAITVGNAWLEKMES